MSPPTGGGAGLATGVEQLTLYTEVQAEHLHPPVYGRALHTGSSINSNWE